jgi:hypothetical protein
MLESNLRSENEKDFLVSTTSVKQFVRVPRITKSNQGIKNEIIGCAERMIGLEERAISDLVDFSNVMMQRLDKVFVAGKNLTLINDGQEFKCKIKDDVELVSTVVNSNFGNQDLLDKNKISLSDLKSSPAIDLKLQGAIKDYIDDLVFALYFNVPVQNLGIKQAEQIKAACKKNSFYKIILEARP